MTLPVAAIVGINGVLGPHVLNAFSSLLFRGKLTTPIKIVTSNATKARQALPQLESSDYKLITSANAATGEGLDQAFQDVDVVINIAGIGFSHNHIVDAVAASKAKVYIPSSFSIPVSHLLGDYQLFNKFNAENEKYAKSFGSFKTVPIDCGGFTEWVFSVSKWSAFKTRNSVLTYEPDAKWNATSLADVGKVIALVASKANTPDKIPEYLALKGGQVSYSDIGKLYEKYTGKKVEITVKPAEEITGPAQKIALQGITKFQDLATLLNAVVTQGYGSFDSNAKEFINGEFELETPDQVAKRLLEK